MEKYKKTADELYRLMWTGFGFMEKVHGFQDSPGFIPKEEYYKILELFKRFQHEVYVNEKDIYLNQCIGLMYWFISETMPLLHYLEFDSDNKDKEEDYIQMMADMDGLWTFVMPDEWEKDIESFDEYKFNYEESYYGLKVTDSLLGGETFLKEVNRYPFRLLSSMKQFKEEGNYYKRENKDAKEIESRYSYEIVHEESNELIYKVEIVPITKEEYINFYEKVKKYNKEKTDLEYIEEFEEMKAKKLEEFKQTHK